MNKIRLVIVEDNEEELQVCADSVKRYERQFQRSVEVVACKSVDEAKDCVDNSFDGAIIDLKLDVRGDEGGLVVEYIKNNLRIPVVIFTGTPQNADSEGGLMRIFKKGETSYEDIFNLFFEIYATGVTKVLGGRGVIEQGMNKVFWKSLVPILESWQKHVVAGKETEAAVLRFVINHLLELLEEAEGCFPEEMYLTPFEHDLIKTGQIVKTKEKDEYSVVLSPACDLVVHNNQMKTDRILLCSIETSSSLVVDARKTLRKTLPDDASEDVKASHQLKQQKANDTLNRLVRNAHSSYYHYLPRTTRFLGGLINFRRVQTCTKKDFLKQFDSISVQIAMTFTKDIVARFSSYYARQGQPDFDFQSLLQDVKGQD